jgi:2'-5' RNA ligase
MRAFLALDLPAWLRAELGKLQRALRPSCPGWRWARPEGIHLTLKFLGEVAVPDAERQREFWRKTVEPFAPVRYRVRGVGVFPTVRQPRVLWVGVQETGAPGCLEPLADALERTARACGFAAEDRRFRPHLTLARAVRDEQPVVPDLHTPFETGETTAREVVLFRSELRPDGARYFPVDTFPLLGSV